MYRRLPRNLLILPAALILAGSALDARANSETIFTPYLDRIENSLPSNLMMRLPSQVPFRGLVQGETNPYKIRVTPESDTSGLTVSLHTCETDLTCLVGSFSVDSPTATRVRDALQQHQAAATPITLAKDIQGYLLEGDKQEPANPFSSVMWEQDGLLYTVRFLARERQTILYMAYSMAHEQPIRSAAASGLETAKSNDSGLASVQFSQAARVVTLPASIFTPYLEQIQQSLPEGWRMRLPEQVSLYHSTVEESQYKVRVLPSASGAGFRVSLLTCEDGSPSCSIGTFSVDSEASAEAQQAFDAHQAAANPITLAKDIQGYLLENSQPNRPEPSSSVMWKQDGLFYTVGFPAKERQNILYMAYSMANSTPILSTARGERGVPDATGQVVQRPDPNTERLLQPEATPTLPSPVENEPVLRVPQAQPADTQQPVTGDRIFVREIQVTGSTVFGSDEFNPIVQPFQGRELTLEEIRQVADAITQLYLDKGYITSRARPVAQTAGDGVVEIRVIEGRLERIEIEGTRRLNPSYIRSRIELGAGTPLNEAKLEDQLRLLRADPLIANIEASLRAEGEIGRSVLVVRVTEADSFQSTFSVDNYSPPSIGSERLGVGVSYRNLTGIGDEVAGSYYRSTTGGADVFDFSYRVPLNPMNGTLQLRAAPTRNEITQPPFDELEIRGRSELYELSYRQPLVRTPREEFALSFGFTFQDGQTFLFNELPTPFGIGPDENGVSRTSVFKLGQDYLSRDSGGAWSLRSQFSIGTGLFDATINDSPTPDGRFFSWLGQVQRVQQLSEDHLLIIRGDVQLTPDSLLPSQQFVIGGGQSLRGYRQNARSGDNGFRVSVEDRITVQRNEAGAPIIQIAPFFDMGAVWNHPDNPNELPDQTFLVGAGVGLLWEPFLGLKGLSLRLDYAIPFIDLSDRGRNAQDEGFYFGINYQP